MELTTSQRKGLGKSQKPRQGRDAPRAKQPGQMGYNSNSVSVFDPLLNIPVHGGSTGSAQPGLCVRVAGKVGVMDCRCTNLDPAGKRSGAVKKRKWIFAEQQVSTTMSLLILLLSLTHLSLCSPDAMLTGSKSRLTLIFSDF